jgi:hydrogenase nickel incorporation protein HypA/HybF
MHEVSVMANVVDSVKGSLAGRDIVRVESVRLEIGDLTMLGREQLRFAWGVLANDGPLKGSRLVIVRKPAVVSCPDCGYRGAPKRAPKAWSHTAIPLISCPKCGRDVEIVGGRETIVRSIRAVEHGKQGARRTVKDRPRGGLLGRDEHCSSKEAQGAGGRAGKARRAKPCPLRPPPCALLERSR